MSKKRTKYTSAFKTKLVLELLQNESTLAQIASKHNILPQNLANWKKTFLANAEIAMEPSKAVKEYKEALIKSQKQNERLTTLVGKVTVEKEWLSKKLVSLGSSNLKQLVDLKPSLLSVNHQCQLLGVNRSGLYYKSSVNHTKQTIKKHITKVFEQIPIYGEKKVHQQLLEEGCKVSLNTVARYRQELGLKAVLAVKSLHTTIPIKAHKKYSYKLRGLDINQANQVWSTDITYIKIAGGMVYMAAVIDWHSKAVLSHRISNTMDTQLVMGVLNDALDKHPHPEIFNTDQGAQYTSEVHTKRLKDLGVTISMDGKGRATDNICIERFWRSAKCERIYLNEYQSISELVADVDDYIEFYNHRRFHETLEYKKPMNVYQESVELNQKKKKASI
ncbi:MAG: IS3 family transposase IS1302 [Catillopecten margaritatus gill symbiont]|uniref:IS3 family transposase IS1302 n=1 Tax=Catillopecten margaritatus gill symbiont TaxID=3083288 RepID=A0AAU6PH60_9GAMM